VLADDFTGACDAAGALAGSRRTVVLLAAPERWPTAHGHAPAAHGQHEAVDVLSIDLDLREGSEADAQRAARVAAQRVGRAGPDARLFLKIDSTLRGPIAGLVAGALRGSGKTVAVLAPAFPEQGRLLHAGTVVVDGKPGPSLMHVLGPRATPATVMNALGPPATPGTVLLGVEVASSEASLEAAIETALQHGARHVVVDADAPACLATIAHAWSRHAEWLLVGSGGLARHLAPNQTTPDLNLVAPPGIVLVIAGSPASMTRAQLEQLPPHATVSVVETGTPTAAMPTSHQGLLVLRTPPASQRDAGESARAVADTVLAWSKQVRPAAVVLAGGATARLVCERLGAFGVALSSELAPGVPIGRLIGGEWDTVMVVTKAGGFGTPTTLRDAVRALVSFQSTIQGGGRP
jgi:D-threonate/D-erythronate kinase